MKKSILISISIGLLLCIIIASPSATFAQEVQPTSGIDGNILFRDLDFITTTLYSPYQSTRVLFSLPAEYKLLSGGELVLNFETFVNGNDIYKNEDGFWFGTLNISLNKVQIYTHHIQDDLSHTINIPISTISLNSLRLDGRHELKIDFVADVSCYYDVNTSIIITDSSYLTLPHTEVAPTLDLAHFPAPFYSPNGIIQSKVNVIVPDAPTEKELEAALLVAAAFGNLTRGDLIFDLITFSDSTIEPYVNENQILVGLSTSLEQYTAEHSLPLPILDNGKFTLINEEDGVIQITRSSANNLKTTLIISGNTENGMKMAAQALSTGSFLMTYRNDLVIISNVQTEIEPISHGADFTLKDLGYQTEFANKIGSTYLDFFFDASVDQVNSIGSYIDLDVNYSNIRMDQNSLVDVSLNDFPVGTIIIANEDPNITTYRFKFPPGSLVPGRNNLQILIQLSPLDACIQDFIWVAIYDSSSIHLDNTNNILPDIVSGIGFNLKSYPELIIAKDFNFDDLAIIFGKSNPSSWSVAAKVIYQLGFLSPLEVPNLTAWFADNVPEFIKNEKALMVFGRPSNLAFISEINDALPAPFPENSDIPTEPGMQISYRIPPEIDLGFLELLNSPWNSQKPIFAFLGNSDNGISIAGNMLLNPILSNQLNGDYAISNGVQVVSANSKISTGEDRPLSEIVPNAEVVVVSPIILEDPVGDIITRPDWIVPAFTITSTLIILIMIYGLIHEIKKRLKKVDYDDVFDRVKEESSFDDE